MCPSTTTEPSNQKQNHVKKKKKKTIKPNQTFIYTSKHPPTPPTQKKTINKAIRANHNATPICQNPPPMCHDLHHKPTQSSPTNKTNTHSILHADQCTSHQATTTIHHRNSTPNPQPKPISKPITTHNQIHGAPLVHTHRLMIMVELR